jgi:hypothetical protein
MIISIEVTIENYNPDIGGKKTGTIVILLIAYYHFNLDLTPIRRTDIPFCKYFIAQAIHENEFVGWRQVLFSSCSADTIIQIRFAVHEYNNTVVEAYGVKITQEYC